MFKIKSLRNILIMSCVISVILPLYNFYFAYPSFIQMLIGHIEEEAVRAGNHLSAMIVDSDNNELTKDSVNVDMLNPDQVLDDFKLMKLKVFAENGETLYSSDPADIGVMNTSVYFHDIVAEGNTYTEVVKKGGRSLEGQKVIVDVVETYVPIMKGGIFKGAFEIYYDITDSKKTIDTQLMESAFIQLFVSSGFLVTLIVVLFRTRKTINDHEIAEVQIEKYKNKLQILISRLSNIEEQERKRISEELHDNIGQVLAISKINISKLTRENPGLAVDLTEIKSYIEQTIEFTRSLTFELSSPILYQLGFEQAVEWLAEQIQKKHDIAIEFNSDKNLRNFRGEISIQLYKTVRELLLNIVKHAEARSAKVSVEMNDGNIYISIEDDGKGFDIGKVESFSIEGKHYGLFSIRERISFIGGTFQISSKLGKGTLMELVVPMQMEQEESLVLSGENI